MSPESPDPDLSSRARRRSSVLAPRRRDAASGQQDPRSVADGESAALRRLGHLLGSVDDELTALSTPLDRRGSTESLQQQISARFSPTAICLVELDPRLAVWSPRLAAGCSLPIALHADELPGLLAQAVATNAPIAVDDLSLSGGGIAPGSNSGLYLPLHVGGRLVGAIGLEHTVLGRLGAARLADAVEAADRWALIVDTSSRLARLRATLSGPDDSGAARELHDRLGQWLTVVSMELEGVIRSTTTPREDLTRLYATVQSAIEEMRDALRESLAGVAPDRPLAHVAAEICERFEERAEIEVDFETTDPTRRLSVPVEAELSRILLVALGNCERHASASRVSVRWATDGRHGTLSITDDGVGFDPSHAVRDATGGLIDIRERVRAIDGHLCITSQPGAGTTVAVSVPATTKERTC